MDGGDFCLDDPSSGLLFNESQEGNSSPSCEAKTVDAIVPTGTSRNTYRSSHHQHCIESYRIRARATSHEDVSNRTHDCKRATEPRKES
jgi:hypothetical protein